MSMLTMMSEVSSKQTRDRYENESMNNDNLLIQEESFVMFVVACAAAAALQRCEYDE